MAGLFEDAGVKMDIGDEEVGGDAASVTEASDPQTSVGEQRSSPADEPFFDPASLAPELQEQWKRMQASFTKGRQRDRETARVATESGRAAAEKAAMVDRFNSDREFALATIMQMAPQLGLTVAQGQQRTSTLPERTSETSTQSLAAIESNLRERLGKDLEFMAPVLARSVMESARAAADDQMAPLRQRLDGDQQRAREQAQQQRNAEEARIIEGLDARMPEWQERYGARMRELDAFLASPALSHPEFGSKHELYLRLLNPAGFRADAVRDMQRAAGNRIATGRSGAQQSVPGTIDKIKDINRKDGWQAAWDYTIKNIDAITEEMERQ